MNIRVKQTFKESPPALSEEQHPRKLRKDGKGARNCFRCERATSHFFPSSLPSTLCDFHFVSIFGHCCIKTGFYLFIYFAWNSFHSQKLRFYSIVLLELPWTWQANSGVNFPLPLWREWLWGWLLETWRPRWADCCPSVKTQGCWDRRSHLFTATVWRFPAPGNPSLTPDRWASNRTFSAENGRMLKC